MASVLNPANAITASRFLTLPPFLYWLDRGDYQLATVAVILCGVADLFDGAVARKFDCSSAFGEMFDAITDALCYGFFMLVLAIYGRLPWIPVIGILGLGAVNSAFRLVYAKRIGRTTNYRSWAMEQVVGYAAYLAAFGAANYEPAFYSWACFIIMTVVLAHDSKRMLIDPVPA